MGQRVKRELSISPGLHAEMLQMAKDAGGITEEELLRRSIGSLKAMQKEIKAGRYVGSVADRSQLVREFKGVMAGD